MDTRMFESGGGGQALGSDSGIDGAVHEPSSGIRQGCSDVTIPWGVDTDLVEPAEHPAPLQVLSAGGSQMVDPAADRTEVLVALDVADVEAATQDQVRFGTQDPRGQLEKGTGLVLGADPFLLLQVFVELAGMELEQPQVADGDAGAPLADGEND